MAIVALSEVHAPAQTARALLESQRDALLAAMTPTSPDYAVAQAFRMIARIRDRLRNYTDHGLETDRGWFGENGWAPAVRDIIRSLGFVSCLRPAQRQEAA